MQTPIFDFVQQYQQEEMARFHMPGHKGQPFLGCEPFDITEVAGADNLQDPEAGGIIARSEQNATALFGTAQTCYSAGGSSACISAMLYLATLAAPAARKGRILAGRNAHKVFLQVCGLLGLQPTWLYPSPTEGQGICGCTITPAALSATLQAQQAQDALPMAVYITSPDYLGNVADVAGLAAVCKAYQLPLLVDNAHGAYLKFLSPSQHPMDLGAAMCCDSAHKTLPVLTGGAYLHLAVPHPDAKAALSLFSSTSPSYLILQSLDLCNRYLAQGYPAQLQTCLQRLAKHKETLRGLGYLVCESEPLKLVLDCRTLKGGGQALADFLRHNRIEPEFADPDFLVCMVTPQNTLPDLARLMLALQRYMQGDPALGDGVVVQQPAPQTSLAAEQREVSGEMAQTMASVAAAKQDGQTLPLLMPHRVACGVRAALFSTGETIAVENAVGRTCRIASVSCPPAIPIVVSGEVITASDVSLFRYYGIETVNVIRE